MVDPRKIDPALTGKYSVSGPRYTSYPPATHFRTVDRDELFRRWRAQNRPENDSGLSLYLHIPFCRTRCLFCGCYTCITRDRSLVTRYVDAMIAEMGLAAEVAGSGRPVRQIAIGGGTPNFLDAPDLGRIFKALRGIWNIRQDAEISIELDPRTVTPEKLDILFECGVNRYSLGVQDLDEEVLSIVRRGQDLMKVEDAVIYLRKNGHERINFDLIYGLPKQDLSTAKSTAEKVVSLRPSRIALYSYAHVPSIRPHQKALERYGLPDPGQKLGIFCAMLDRFEGAGYIPIGMDHFALPSDSLAAALGSHTLHRNFMGYTTGGGIDLAGFGASAISSIGPSYSQNAKELESYIGGVAGGSLPIERGFLLSGDDVLRRAFILELFCNFSVDFEKFGEAHGADVRQVFSAELSRLAPFEADGLVTMDGRSLAATETGRFFIRNICMVFDRYLETDAAARPYSRTV